MQVRRAVITLPEELLAEIDATVGPGDLVSFVIDLTRAELLRRRPPTRGAHSFHAGEACEPAPGTSGWNKSIREEGEARLALRHF